MKPQARSAPTTPNEPKRLPSELGGGPRKKRDVATAPPVTGEAENDGEAEWAAEDDETRS
jgi:hypothetical protein